MAHITKTLKKHEQEYIHIPKPNSKWFCRLGLLCLTVFISITNFFLIKSFWIKENLGYVFAEDSGLINYTPKLFDLMILYPILAEFIFISLIVILVVSLFKKLKRYDKEGLIGGLIVGLILEFNY